jgi:hypothetical protein
MLRRLVLAALSLALLAAGARRSFADDVFTTKGEELAADAIANPALFFFDFQKDMESLTPLPPGQWFGLNWHMSEFYLVPVPDPTILNLSAKLRVQAEGHWLPGLPQLDLIGGYWNADPIIDATGIVDKNAPPTGSTQLTSFNFNGYYAGAVMTSSLEPRMRLFWGYKYSQMDASLAVNKGVNVLGTNVKSFSTGYSDHYLFAGLEHPTDVNRWWDVLMFYGLTTNDFGAKISWYWKNFEFGLNIYPESVIVIHPVLNWHMNFGS